MKKPKGTSVNETIRHYDDIQYSVRMWLENSHVAGFTAHRINHWEERPEGEIRFYPLKDYNTLPEDATTDLQAAEVWFEGSIKWDGCANVQFPAQESVMLHFCGRKDFQELAELFQRLYALASEVMGRELGD